MGFTGEEIQQSAPREGNDKFNQRNSIMSVKAERSVTETYEENRVKASEKHRSIYKPTMYLL